MLPQLHAYYIARGIFGAMIVLSGIVQIVNIGMTIFTDTAERRRRETLRRRRGDRAAAGDELMAGRGQARQRRGSHPRGWARHPRERMLITPLVAGLGGLLAFFTVVSRSSSGCRSTPSTRRPPPTGRRSPNAARQGPQPVRAERLLRLPLRLLAAAGRARGALLPLPEGLAAGRLLGQRPVAEPARHRAHRPRLSQESGWHPDDWQRRALLRPALHRPDVSLMPDMKSLFSDTQVEQLVTFVEQRSGKSGPAALRRAAVREARRARRTRASRRRTRASRARTSRSSRRTDKSLNPPKDQLEEAPNLAQIDRSYWLSGNPLPVTEQNLLRGKEVFLERCVGCHGSPGTARGRARRSCRRRRPTSPSADDACCGGDTGPGDFYYRILRGWPGTAMENFGDRLSVERHLARRAVREDDPERHARARTAFPSRRTTSSGSPRRSCWPGSKSTTEADRQRVLRRRRLVTDPFMQEAMRVLPRPRAGRPASCSTTGSTRRSRCETPRAGIKAIYQDMLDRAWSDAQGSRRQAAQPSAQKVIPPDGAGPAMRRLALAVAVASSVPLHSPAGARVRSRRSRRAASRAG